MKRKRTDPSDGPATKEATVKASNKILPSIAKVDDDDDAFLALKHALAITPKTTHLLLKSGYTTYQSLAKTTPNQVLQKFEQYGGMDKKVVEGYRRAVRRIVWLGTQPDPHSMAKHCQTWTVKNLRLKGVWLEGWDDLTGEAVNQRFGNKLRQDGL